MHGQGYTAYQRGITVAEAAQPARPKGAGATQEYAAHKAKAPGWNNERNRNQQPTVQGWQQFVAEKGRVQHLGPHLQQTLAKIAGTRV